MTCHQECCSGCPSFAARPFDSTARALRACADRLWSAGRSVLPAVPRPCFSHESPHSDDHLREGYPEVYDLPSPLCTPHQLLVGVVPRTRPLHYPPISGPERCRLALPGDLREQAALLQPLSGGLRVVAAVEVDTRLLGQPSEGLGHCIEGFGQQRRVVSVGWSRDGT